MTKWPDWCSEYGWDNEYTDAPEWFGHDPYSEDPRNPVPEALKEMLEADASLASMLEAERYAPEPHLWERVKMPTPTRKHWLSRASAKHWVEVAKALGAEVRMERGWVVWEDELNEKLAKLNEGV